MPRRLADDQPPHIFSLPLPSRLKVTRILQQTPPQHPLYPCLQPPTPAPRTLSRNSSPRPLSAHRSSPIPAPHSASASTHPNRFSTFSVARNIAPKASIPQDFSCAAPTPLLW